MEPVELPLGLDGSEDLPRTKRGLQNCFNNGKGEVITRPGISSLTTTGKVARGSFTWNNALYQVVSQSLIKITNTATGAHSTIGTIEGPEPIATAVGFNEAVIVVKGGKSYTLDDSDTLADTSSNSNFVPFVDVDHIDGRFIYIPADGSPAKVSDVGDGGTIGGLAFFDAESLPDKNNAVDNFKNTLLIGGTDSFEPFRASGIGPIWFQRVPGGRIEVGYIGGKLKYRIAEQDALLCIGRKTGQSPRIYAIDPGQAIAISNPAIDLILSTYTQTELAEAIAGRVEWRGYDIATFSLRRHSFGFYAGQWFSLDTVFDGVSRPWGAGYITQFGGEYFTAYADKIGKFGKVNTDYGNPITRIIDIGFNHPRGNWFGCHAVELGISQGYNAAAGSVALMMSRDNVTYGQPIYRNLGAIGQYEQRLIWQLPGGLGRYNGFMGMRIYTTEDIEFSADLLRADIR